MVLGNLVVVKSNPVLYWIKVVAIVAVAVVLAVFAVRYRFNLGKALQDWFGLVHRNPVNPIRQVVNSAGVVVGGVVPLQRNNDPFRDKTVIEIADGTRLQLPDGLIDSDIEVAIK